MRNHVAVSNIDIPHFSVSNRIDDANEELLLHAVNRKILLVSTSAKRDKY